MGVFFTASYGMCIDLCAMTKLNIGEDCMFSWDVEIRTGDGHSIFDVNTGKNINSTSEICGRHSIQIGNHVWIGFRSIILYDTKIGDGSIVGAGSLVKSKFPNNCIVAGVPAKIIRYDVSWCRENMEQDVLKCGEKYIERTSDK